MRGPSAPCGRCYNVETTSLRLHFPPDSMPTARYWPVSRLLLTWLALFASLAALRWSLIAGTYEASIQNQRVVTSSGVWSSGFATLMTGVGVTVVVLALVWATVTWISGHGERRAERIQATAGHRKILM